MKKVIIINTTLNELDRRFPPKGMVGSLVQADKYTCRVNFGFGKIILPSSQVKPIYTDLIDIPIQFWSTKNRESEVEKNDD